MAMATATSGCLAASPLACACCEASGKDPSRDENTLGTGFVPIACILVGCPGGRSRSATFTATSRRSSRSCRGSPRSPRTTRSSSSATTSTADRARRRSSTSSARLPKECPARIVALRGNHEDAWLRVIERGWPEFVMPVPNGCLAAMRSFTGGAVPGEDEEAQGEEMHAPPQREVLPADVVEWMNELPYWYEDEHAIYVHAGLPSSPGRVRPPVRGEAEGGPPLVPRRGLLPRLPRKDGRLRTHRHGLPPARAVLVHARGPRRHLGRARAPSGSTPGAAKGASSPRSSSRRCGCTSRARRRRHEGHQETLTVATRRARLPRPDARSVRGCRGEERRADGALHRLRAAHERVARHPGERRSRRPPRSRPLAREARARRPRAYEHDAEGPDDMPGHLRAADHPRERVDPRSPTGSSPSAPGRQSTSSSTGRASRAARRRSRERGLTFLG